MTPQTPAASCARHLSSPIANFKVVNMRHLSRLLLAGVVAGLTACTSLPSQHCATGFKPMTSALIYFGANIPQGGSVSPAEWQDFLDAVVTPRFPDGFSVWSAAGQWRSAAGTIEQEASRVLNILHQGGASEAQALDEIASSYRQRFQQEAVLHAESRVCARF